MSDNGIQAQTPIQVAQSVIRSLLANLMGDSIVSGGQGAYRVEPDDLKHFHAEKRILEIIYMLERAGKNPTVASVRDTLLVGGEDYVKTLEAITSLATEDRDVYSASFAIKNIYMEKRKNAEILQKMNQIMNSNIHLPNEQRVAALDELRQHIVNQDELQALDQVDMTQTFLKRLAIFVYNKKHGIAPGPTFPFKALQALVSHMRRGELISLMAKSKYGKTLIGQIFAEHWSWGDEQNKYTTHIWLFETSPDLYWQRFVVRNCLIPSKNIEWGDWDIQDEKHPASILFKQWIKDKVNLDYEAMPDGDKPFSIGNIVIHPAYGKNHLWLESEIEKVELNAKATGEQNVHVIDYLQKIDNSFWRNDLWNKVAAWLKDFTQRLDLYMFCLVQEQEGSSRGINDKVYPKSGNEITKQSQVFMRLERFVAQNSMEVPKAVNSMGKPRYYHQFGQFHSMGQIQVTHANEDSLGNADIIFENELYIVRSVRDGSYLKSQNDEFHQG